MFTALDLSKGCHQIPSSEDTRKKTAFMSENEASEFNWLAKFGLKNASFEFIKLMNLLIPAKPWPDMLNRIELVLNVLRDGEFTLKLSKSKFANSKVNYVGFKVTKDDTIPRARKTIAIRDFLFSFKPSRYPKVLKTN